MSPLHQIVSQTGRVTHFRSCETGHSNFITGAGGFLQNIVQGWAGVRIEADAMSISRPTLPPTVTSVRLRSLQFRGASFTVQYDATNISFVAAEPRTSARLMVREGSAAAHKLSTRPVVFPCRGDAAFTIVPAN